MCQNSSSQAARKIVREVASKPGQLNDEVLGKPGDVSCPSTFMALNTCQFFARTMKDAKARGAIINISSAVGIMAIPNRLGYVGSKFVVGITRAISLEPAPLGIRVNGVAPGVIRTGLTESMFQDPKDERRIRAAHPIGCEGTPEEGAAAIAFLLSEDASFITGVILPVDGGYTTGVPAAPDARAAVT
jgi:meso-butanediol dehydrogenase / (S,S)-butanediol dehydrogenase / diacetyl reductase